MSVYKGGLLIRRDFGNTSVTRPFGVLKISKDNIEIYIDYKSRWASVLTPIKIHEESQNLDSRFVYRFSEIKSAKRKMYLPIIADGIKIMPKSGEPEWFIFWTRSAKEILNELKKFGVDVE